MGSNPHSVKDPRGQKDILRIFLSIFEWKSANDAGFLDFFNDSEMFLLRHEGDEIGTVAKVTEVLYDDLCVQGRGSRVLLAEYPTGEGMESVPCVPPLNPTVRTCGCLETRPQAKLLTEQGCDKNRMSFHP
jgi:hypothetical protein